MNWTGLAGVLLLMHGMMHFAWRQSLVQVHHHTHPLLVDRLQMAWGHSAIRTASVVAGVCFVAAGIMALTAVSWWPLFAYWALFLSLGGAVLTWPETPAALPLNVVVGIGLTLGSIAGVWT